MGKADIPPPYIDTVCAAVADGQIIETLYDEEPLSIRHFRSTYSLQFVRLVLDGYFSKDADKVPTAKVARPEKGKRGETPKNQSKAQAPQKKGIYIGEVTE